MDRPQANAPSALSASCSRCGGALVLSGALLRCPYCGNQQQVPTARAHAFARYQDEVARLGSNAEQDLRTADVWNRHYSGRGAKSGRVQWVFMLMGLPVLLISVGMATLSSSGVNLDPQLWGTISAACVIVCSIGGPIGYYAWFYSGRKRRSEGLSNRSIRQVAVCPRCGASGAFVPGQVVEPCCFCGAQMLAGHTLVSMGISHAEAAARAARLQMRRSERNGYLAIGRMSNSNTLIFVFAALPVIVGLSVAAVGATSEYVNGREPRSSSLATLVTAWVVVVAMIGSSLVYVLRKRARTLRWRRAVAALAAQLRGAALEGALPAQRWLDAFWPSQYPAAQLGGGPDAQSIVAQHRGFPLLVFANPRVPQDARPAHAEILLAGELLGLPDTPAAHASRHFEEARCFLGANGFSLEACQSGLRAFSKEAFARELLSHPDRLAILFPIAEALAGVLSALRARPPTPIAEA